MNDQRANWNVTSAVNYAGVPLERVRLTPYGEPTFDTITVNGDLDFDGDVDSADGDAMTACYTNGFSSGDCNTVDYDDSRSIDIWDLLYHANFTGLQRQPGRTTSANRGVTWRIGRDSTCPAPVRCRFYRRPTLKLRGVHRATGRKGVQAGASGRHPSQS